MRRLSIIAIGAALAGALAGCGSDDVDAPTSPAVGADRLAASAGALRGGGLEAYQSQLAKLEGTPVVVNQWASWCGPCRFEFPFFISQAKRLKGRVAFLGVDSNDARADAEEFLREFPTPYPHFEDGELEIARSFRAGRVWPSTAFYDAKGELVYTHHGAYPSEERFAEEIAKYTGVGSP